MEPSGRHHAVPDAALKLLVIDQGERCPLWNREKPGPSRSASRLSVGLEPPFGL